MGAALTPSTLAAHRVLRTVAVPLSYCRHDPESSRINQEWDIDIRKVLILSLVTESVCVGQDIVFLSPGIRLQVALGKTEEAGVNTLPATSVRVSSAAGLNLGNWRFQLSGLRVEPSSSVR